jgi:hypothetical protein
VAARRAGFPQHCGGATQFARQHDQGAIDVDPRAVDLDGLPPSTVRVLASTVTEPLGPDCSPVAEAAIWVLATPAPSGTSAPGVVTSTEPPLPVPAVVLAISPPVVIVICGAATITEPALPLAVEFAEALIPVPGSVNVRGPCAVTSTVPPLPVPAVLEVAFAPRDSAIELPANSATSPAWSLEPAWAEAVIPLAPWRAVIGMGSPFPPVLRDSMPFTVDQTNNAYVFPGIGLGVLAARAGRVTDGMFVAAAKTLADVSPAVRDPKAHLLPPVAELRAVAVAVARAVARQARAEGQCEPCDEDALDRLIARKMWEAVYRPYHRRTGS